MTKQKLGPKQTAWVEALESNKYIQGQNYLKVVLKNKPTKHCCLGVLCEIEKLEQEEPYNPKGYVTFKDKDRISSKSFTHLPEDLREKYKFFGCGGDINGSFFEDPDDISPFTSLVDMNDDSRFSFKDIAAFIRKFPQVIFKEAV